MNFNPRTPCGVRPDGRRISCSAAAFQSTHPLRGATQIVCVYCGAIDISIHAPLAGCDAPTFNLAFSGLNFNPRTPCGVRLFFCLRMGYDLHISIHAPLAGCDFAANATDATQKISIHAPLAGCDRRERPNTPILTSFQSTHPLRGATINSAAPSATRIFQSTHPLRGATHAVVPAVHAGLISIHAPLAGCDSSTLTIASLIAISIHAPLAGCDRIAKVAARSARISIHAPLAGCDRQRAEKDVCRLHFNPRTPCGVRLKARLPAHLPRKFQSTHPLRGATIYRKA